jgi:hypothetical protein
MPDDTKVFDVTKPGRTAPAPTSRPIIVGQNTTGVDTMVKETPQPEPVNEGTPSTAIHVSMADEESENVMAQTTHPEMPHEEHQEFAPVGATIPPHELDEAPQQPGENTAGSNFTPLTSLIPNPGSKEDTGEYGAHHVDKLPESHEGDPGWQETPPLPISRGAGPKRRLPKFLMWLLILALLVVIGGFLAIDAGLVKSDIDLPFHIFNKQKTSKATSAPTPKTTQPVSPAPVQSSVPEGFTKYSVEGTGVSFAYPTAWGAPTTTKDPGFSKRGGTNKTDGTYAHIVDFATNKDIQIALTSSKYLPAARGALYYDFLQWCTGTNDAKLYKQTLHFTTENKVDTPSTLTCDQGPLSDAAKLDDTTIFQHQTKDAAGIVLGDLYTRNLTSNKDLPVLRVKDKAMKSADDIKKLLANAKTDSSATSGAQ